MSSPLSLMELPDDDKLKILEQCDLKSIFALRRTCHDFRNLIDDKKPDGKIRSIDVDSYCDINCISFTVYDQSNHCINVDYRPVDEGCEVAKKINWGPEKKLLVPGQNHTDIFIQDFKTIMSYQKKVLRWMSLNLKENNGTIKPVYDYLKTRKNQMKVEKLRLILPKESQIADFLPFFDSNYLEGIDINFLDADELSQELVRSDQWKSAQYASISVFNLGMMDHCLHFEKITGHCDDTVTDAEHIPAFKRKMHESRDLETMTMFFGADTRVIRQLGSCITLENDGKEFTY